MSASNRGQAVGVYGGTFDPIHLGHLRTAQEVLERLGLEYMLMVPAGRPAHRQAPLASARQRLAMVRLALTGVPGLLAESCEVERAGPSYMVDTLAQLRRRYPAVSLVLVIGMDAFHGLPRWHQWQRIPDLAHLLVMVRPGASGQFPSELQNLLAQRRVADPAALHATASGCIHFMRVSQLEISASAIRSLVAAGSEPRFLVPEAVRGYIAAARLYADADAASGAGVDEGGSAVPSGMALERLDHWVLTVNDIAASVTFYRDRLGMQLLPSDRGRTALRFGPHRINLHPVGSDIVPRARRALPGSADLCLVTALDLPQLAARLAAAGVVVEQGPVARSGALGPIHSLYVRDPDDNLIELASYSGME